MSSPAPDLSTRDDRFWEVADAWLLQGGEILVMLRYSRAAGSRDWYFARDSEWLRSLIGPLPAETSVILFRQSHLPLRGTAGKELAESAEALLPDGVEFLVVQLEPHRHHSPTHSMEWTVSQAGESHAELREAIDDLSGHAVAIGQHPPFWQDNEDILEAIVPFADGSVKRGIY
jgi:hypothetical protein